MGANQSQPTNQNLYHLMGGSSFNDTGTEVVYMQRGSGWNWVCDDKRKPPGTRCKFKPSSTGSNWREECERNCIDQTKIDDKKNIEKLDQTKIDDKKNIEKLYDLNLRRFEDWEPEKKKFQEFKEKYINATIEYINKKGINLLIEAFPELNIEKECAVDLFYVPVYREMYTATKELLESVKQELTPPAINYQEIEEVIKKCPAYGSLDLRKQIQDFIEAPSFKVDWRRNILNQAYEIEDEEDCGSIPWKELRRQMAKVVEYRETLDQNRDIFNRINQELSFLEREFADPNTNLIMSSDPLYIYFWSNVINTPTIDNVIKNIRSDDNTKNYIINREWLDGREEYSALQKLRNKVDDCFKGNRHAVIKISYMFMDNKTKKMDGHANSVLIDRFHKNIYFLEPNMGYEIGNKGGKVPHFVIHGVRPMIKAAERDLSEYGEFYNLSEYGMCPIGVQTIQQRGTCQTWALYFLYTILTNPTYSNIFSIFDTLPRNKEGLDKIQSKFLYYIYINSKKEIENLEPRKRYWSE